MGASALSKKGFTAATPLADVVDMGGQTISLFKFEGVRKSGKTYSVEAYVVMNAEPSWHSETRMFAGTIHRTDGKPTTRNCHEARSGDLLQLMLETIDQAVRWCDFVEVKKDKGEMGLLTNSVHDCKWTYGSPAVEAQANRTRGLIEQEAIEFRQRMAS